jgi:hypothetical protein
MIAPLRDDPESRPPHPRPELPVPRRAERLEDGAVEDVGADRDRRLEAEDEDQHRRHQRAAAHARHADEQTDEKAREGKFPVQVSSPFGGPDQWKGSGC